MITTITFIEDFLPNHEEVFKALKEDITWRQDNIVSYGKTHKVPRLQQWFSDPDSNGDMSYTWSGIKMEAEPWPQSLLDIKTKMNADLGMTFNSALANLYRNGDDTVGWHSDNESALGVNPIIASLSLGEPRDFILRLKSDHKVKEKSLLTPGSLLLMFGDTQEKWEHTLPRRKKVSEPRINVTFRTIKTKV